MSEFNSLLPSSAEPVTRDLEVVISERESDLGKPFYTLLNPLTCPANLLPFLAWQFSSDNWDEEWSEETKRQHVARSLLVHRYKGTLKGVRDALSAAGYGDAEVIERHGWAKYDGEHKFDGRMSFARPDHWAEYRIRLQRPITRKQAAKVRAILRNVAPARCRLRALDFREVSHTYNGQIRFDGQFTFGAA